MTQAVEPYNLTTLAQLYCGRVEKGDGRRLWDGDRIREIRDDRRMSQADLVAKSGTSKSEVGRHEGNASTSNPTIDVLIRLALALEVPIDALFDPVGSAIPRSKEWRRERSVGGEGGGARVADRLRDLIDYVSTLSGQTRARFIDAATAILASAATQAGDSIATGTDKTKQDGS